MRFVKMHGLSNDFIVLDEPVTTTEIIRLCDRRRGVGADGVLTVEVEGDAVRMGYWNADGSPAEMCGNGLRCVARYARDRYPLGDRFVVVTPVGPRWVVVSDLITVELGPVGLLGEARVGEWQFSLAEVGNPHAIAFVDDPALVDVETDGRRVGTDSSFPDGTNVEFVSVASPERLDLRVWERGVGETPACGSGMVASAAVARSRGLVGDTVAVGVTGGVATVSFDADDVAWLTGPAEYVFSGEV